MTLDRVNTSLDDIRDIRESRDSMLTETRKLTDELVEALRDAYGQYTLQQLGDAAGLSRERVRQLLKEEK